jgi:hypothetical protein
MSRRSALLLFATALSLIEQLRARHVIKSIRELITV